MRGVGRGPVARLRRVIAAARGEVPADLVLRGGRVVNVFTGERERADVAIVGDRIVGVGRYEGRQTRDVRGGIVAPGLVDGHLHVESTMLTPAAFARAVVPRGTTAVVIDPHEIANAAGVEGMRWLLGDTHGLPLTFYVQVPSCVPASRLETSGGRIDIRAVSRLLARPQVLGLAEVMEYAELLAGDAGVLRKLAASANRVIDGHAPDLSGPDLNAYLAAGPTSDHEVTTPAEAREKLRRGMTVMLRQSSVARDMQRLLPAIPPPARDRCLVVTDDLLPEDLLHRGHMDGVLRDAVRSRALRPVEALRMATLNAAHHFRLPRVGAVAPGWRADLVVFEDLRRFRARLVLHGGRVVAEDGRPTVPVRGALATSVSHDAHNIVVAGMDEQDMLTAVREIQRMQGGVVAVQRGRFLARLALPVAGLVTEEPLPRVAAQMDALTRAARGLGVRLPHPFLTLSFVTLAVIPHLKLTDRGLVDVDAGRIVPLWLDGREERP